MNAGDPAARAEPLDRPDGVSARDPNRWAAIDIERAAVVAHRFDRAADEIDRFRGELVALVDITRRTWPPPDPTATEWTASLVAELDHLRVGHARAADELRTLAQRARYVDRWTGAPPGTDHPSWHRPGAVGRFGAWPAVAERWNDAVDDAAAPVVRTLVASGAIVERTIRAARDPLRTWNETMGGRPTPPSGGDPGGTYTTRPLHPHPGTAAAGGGPADRGRLAVHRLLAMTGAGYPDTGTPTSTPLQPDEFALVRHGPDRYTVVLPGVTDLRVPRVGLDPHHRSVRDLDVAAAPSVIDATVANNPYAQMVIDGLAAAGVPQGADVAIVGHSFGADTALDLAADPHVNGDRYRITHVIVAGYHIEPLLEHVQPGTDVLGLVNTRDVPVFVETLHDRLTIDSPTRLDHDATVVTFTGRWAGAGHDQQVYLDHLATTTDPTVTAFFASLDRSGYATPGTTVAIDVSVPRDP